ncbi:MAG: RNA polymerase sigma-70 factor [Tannerellaceae bacterium]|jgi:RNA polymerase sigma-70 factor (ECF subfamily)|nr:RNA polymerase sigma-70 factor [Tannerellaceae bacterium]
MKKHLSYEEFYKQWYFRMKSFAREYVVSESDAEDIVQDIFLELYESYPSFVFHVNLVGYVYTSVKNRCIDLLRKRITEQEAVAHIQEEYVLRLRIKFDSLEALNDYLFDNVDVETVIMNAIESLPERCRTILICSKLKGMKQKEIAQELNISVKTVENQMSIAYKKLHELLSKYLELFS